MEKFTFADGTSLTDFGHRYFFYSGLSVRHSCAECKFCNMTRPSDISIGDFWGIENVAPAFNSDNKGVSLVIVNTEKGKRLLSGSESELNLLEVETSQVLQPNLIHPTPANPLLSLAVPDRYALKVIKNAFVLLDSILLWRYLCTYSIRYKFCISLNLTSVKWIKSSCYIRIPY